MTINSETRVAGPFEGNDSTTEFPFAFKVFDSDEVLVVRATDAIETVLTLGADYSVTLNPDQNASPGGVVTLLLGALATGSTLTLTSDLEFLQPLDLTNQGGFYPRVINNAFDRVTILLQQLASIVGRTLKFPLSDGPVGDLPGRSARAGTVLAFDVATGEPIAGPDIGQLGTVAAGIAAIGTVASNIADVNTVTGSIANVNTVASNIADVNTVTGSIANVNTVASNIADVNTVADNIADLSNFSGVYYGPSATDPTTRRDGSPLQVGDLYFNTFLNALRQYNGTVWVGNINGAVTVQNLSGDGVETEFLLNYAPESEIITQVYISGVYQQKNTYSLGGVGDATLIFDEAPPAGTDNIEIVVSSLTPSDDALRLDLDNHTDPTKGASIVGRGAVAVDSVVALLSQPTARAQHVSVASYHQGWAATARGPLGASVWAWDATEPKANHNGFDKISPTVPWSGAFATMDAFQAGTGETAPGTNGCWLRVHGANDVVSWGALPVTGTNNHSVLSRSIEWAYDNSRKLRVNSGVFEFGTTLDLSYPTLVLQGDGFRNTVLKCTGSGRATDAIGTRPNNGAYSFDLDLSDFTIEGNAATTDLLRLRINHARLTNINLREASTADGCGLRVEGVVLGHFENVTCSTNTQLMTSRPLVGLILDQDPTDSRRASANTFINATMEGASADGIQLKNADNNTFVGGTSENNPGVGVSLLAGCRINMFTGMGFENAGYADVIDEGEMNQFYNCYGTNGIYHGASSQGHLVRGGYWQRVEGHASALLPDIDNIQFNFLTPATGTFSVPSVTARVGRNIRNEQGGVQYSHKKTVIPITPTSGILITNTYGIDVDIYVSGGTVTQIVEYRTGSPFLNLPTTGKFHILPEDGIVISFSSAPTVTIVPRS